MNKILLVGFVCLSLGAFAQSAQSSADQSQTSDAKSASTPREASSGQASGKRQHQPLVVHRDLAARDQATGKATGKTSASDDWNAGASAKSSSSSHGQASTHVAAGDVNGDGKAELKATKNSGHATEKSAVLKSNSSVQSPRDSASGQASGK